MRWALPKYLTAPSIERCSSRDDAQRLAPATPLHSAHTVGILHLGAQEHGAPRLRQNVLDAVALVVKLVLLGKPGQDPGKKACAKETKLTILEAIPRKA